MQLIAALVIAASTPFVGDVAPQPVEPAQAPVPAIDIASVTPPAPEAPAAAVQASAATVRQPSINAPSPGSAPVNGALSNLVADAIKRKLDKTAARNPGAVEQPAAQATAAASMAPIGPGLTTPDPAMMGGGGTRVMMGSPTDGSPSFVRVLSPDGGAASNAETAPANPLAPSTDPMESGGATSAAAAEPGVNHNLLDIFVGTWDVSANFDNGPGQPPETASGQMVNSWQLDGRWLKQEYNGKMASLGSFRGLGYLGYDNLAKRFVATWMDTLSTSCMSSTGSFSEEKATFTLSGDFTGPGGEKYRQKQVMTVLSPDRYTVTMYLTGPDGVEFKTGNLEYTRSVRTLSGATGK
ncbi:MAG TPA: DUF1579 domain-containing protein [Phycisphaerales bacterium]|nr:DUF1579 domain-containing protein [Phycisphaerales bacterium]